MEVVICWRDRQINVFLGVGSPLGLGDEVLNFVSRLLPLVVILTTVLQ